MDQLPKKHNLPKLTQGETDNLNRTICIKYTESVINNLPIQKIRGSDGFTGEFSQTFKEEIIPFLYNIFKRTEAEGILPKSFYEASIFLIPKRDKDFTRQENYRLLSLMNIDSKIVNKILANQIQQYIKELYTMAK